MTRWDGLPPSFRFAVRDTTQNDTVAVFKAVNGRLRDSGRKVDIAPFTKANMDKIAQLIERLRTQPRPAIDYITNQFIDVHRSSGRSHVLGAMLTNTETQGDHFDLDTAARQGLANRAGNCDRVNAAGNRMITLFDIKDPVLFHWTTAGNHNVNLVGDPRMAKYGERNTVVLDPYAVFPMPHTLAEASYEMHVPQPNEPEHADLDVWHPSTATSRFNPHPLPEAIGQAQQRAWLRAKGWSEKYGADVVKAWHEAEMRETGKAPDRWESLFSCKDPSVRYATGEGPAEAMNRLPAAFARQRVEAFSQLHEQFPETTRPSLAAQEGGRRPSSARLVAARLGSNALAEASVARDEGSAAVSSNPQSGLSLHHVTPMHTLVTDLHTGEVLMEMHGSQIPVDKVNHGFPIKDPERPYAIHPDYVSPTDPFRCHPNVKVKHAELPPETKAIMRSYFPVAAAKPGYFAARAAEIKAEYEAPLNSQTPPSALRWKPKRLTTQECYSQVQAKALVGAFGVVAVDDSEQNVGGMGPSFAGAELKTAAQRRQYIAQTSKGAFDDFSMRAGNPNNPRELARFAPYGGGNLAQFMNGKATPEDQAHFIAVDVIVHTTNKFGEPRRLIAPHFFQIAQVPKGKQAILDYGDGGYFYGGQRPGMSLQDPQASDAQIKPEPMDDDVDLDVPMREAGAALTSPSSTKRPAPGAAAEASKRPRLSLDARSSIGPVGASTTRRMQALTIHEPEDDDLSSLSSLPDTDEEIGDSEYEEAGETSAAGARRVDGRVAVERGRSDEQIIAQLPAEIWERAQVMATQPRLPEGVTFHGPTEKKPKPHYQSHLRQVGLGHFTIIQGRDNARARALAIATRLEAEAREGAATRKDADVISRFPAALWDGAQASAKLPGLPTGVSRVGNRFIAGIKVDGKQKSLGSFSITTDRSEALAKALAIATRAMEEKGNNVQQQDQAIIDGFPQGVWAAAQQRAGQPGLPRGVSFREPSAREPSGRYIVMFKNKPQGSFAALDERNDLKAKSLAIATRVALENAAGSGDTEIIASFPPGLWDRARAAAAEDGLPKGVTYTPPKGRVSAVYNAWMRIDGKKSKLGHFSVMGDRDELTAKALAIAKRWAAE
ncbi:hypothetical protein EAH72_34465 [Pseudomonas caspiana]|nr:hypothetical protein [Pseudomonas caspiana]TPG86731.1 hypothetical protein EAH72_34465 [Pseudomonas caspiana]